MYAKDNPQFRAKLKHKFTAKQNWDEIQKNVCEHKKAPTNCWGFLIDIYSELFLNNFHGFGFTINDRFYKINTVYSVT